MFSLRSVTSIRAIYILLCNLPSNKKSYIHLTLGIDDQPLLADKTNKRATRRGKPPDVGYALEGYQWSVAIGTAVEKPIVR